MQKSNLVNEIDLSTMLIESGLDDSCLGASQSDWPATLDKFLNIHELLRNGRIGGMVAAWQNLREYLSLLREFEDGVRRIRALKRIEMARTRNWTFCSYFRDSLEILKYRIILRVAYVGHLFGVSLASQIAQSAGMKIWAVLFFECGVV